MNALYVGAALIGLGALIAVLVLIVSSAGPTGVAKSLSLIDQSVDHRAVPKTDLPAKDRLVDPIFDRTRSLGNALAPSGTSERLTRMLDRSGNPAGWNVERLMGAKGTGVLTGLLVGFLLPTVLVPRLPLVIALGVAGFFMPDLFVYNAALRRQEQTARGLAEALDMLTICVEAGQGFDAALMQVARNVEGPISGEFARVISEIQLGKSRGEAFQAMGERVQLPEVKNFTTALVQADRLGLPIAHVLREQTANMRLIRKQKAEEKAQKVAIKILFPLILCIFPVIFVVLLGPGVIRIIENFSQL